MVVDGFSDDLELTNDGILNERRSFNSASPPDV
jgi:hypothetical protein